MDRVDRIYDRMEAERYTCEGFVSEGYYNGDLLLEPGFADMTFMQRKARYVEAILDHVGVRIFPDELLCGTFIGTWARANWTTYEERRAFADMNLAFPRRNNMVINGETVYSSKPLRLTDEELKNPFTVMWSWGHSCGGFKRILQMGYEGIAEEAARRIEGERASDKPDEEKIAFWEAVITCVRAVCRVSDRYADTLERQAEEETGLRQAELRQIAINMRKVPARPAETFWEALQSIWFSFMCQINFNGTDVGRLDQMLYPYYQADIAAGRLTPDEAEELIDGFFLKCYEHYLCIPTNAGLMPAIMLGGLKADGQDGTNEITFMCLRAIERFATPMPKISVRVNEQTPPEIFEQARRMLLKGISQPDFYSDRVMIAAYERIGVPFEDAVEYVQSTCEEISLGGISEDCTNEGPHCDVHDKVILAMRRVAGGEQADTFEDFISLVEAEMRACIRDEMRFHEEQTEKLRRFSPQPLHSASIVGCLESGRDITAGGARYNNTGSVIGGLATAADGLYAINRLVYEEKRLTIAGFLKILEADYEGYEDLRREILNRYPKFGNDDDRVDALAARLFDVYADELEKHSNSRGGCYKVGAWASEYRSTYMATPDGRKKGDAFAVNISPTPGRDIKGVTAVIRSGTKINMRLCSAGAMLDAAMNPDCLKGEDGAVILEQIVRTYGALGGGGLQFNVVDAETLKQAQLEPERFRNLMVRVWGYNDYFISLPKSKQENIIARTFHCGA